MVEWVAFFTLVVVVGGLYVVAGKPYTMPTKIKSASVICPLGIGLQPLSSLLWHSGASGLCLQVDQSLAYKTLPSRWT